MKIAILSGHNKENIDYVDLNWKLIERYCDKWDYDFIKYTGKDFYFSADDPKLNRPWYFANYSLAARHLADYDYLLILDSDVSVVGKTSLEAAYGLPDDQTDIYITPDIVDTLNTGVMLLRNSELSRRFLDAMTYKGIQGRTFEGVHKIHHFIFENDDQGAFMELFHNNFEDMMIKTRWVPARIFNAMQTNWWGAPTDRRYSVCKDTLFFHQAGVPQEFRAQYIKEFIKTGKIG